MSAHPIVAGADILPSVSRYLRTPSNVTGDPVSGALTLHFTPDLSPAEVATLAELDAAAKTALDGLTPADWAAIGPRLANLRTFRQQTRNEFMAKTADQRDRELFDLGTDLAAIVLRVLRD
jgi:hypothetical protein